MVRLPEYVVFDLETIADRPAAAEHEIIQIGAVLASDDGILAEFDTFVRPVSRGRLPDRVTELTGITFGYLENAPPLGDVLRRFFDWVDDRPMIAHNGFGYDFIVLDAAVKPLGLVVPAGPRLDTLELAHIVHPRAGAKMIRGVDGERPPAGRSLDQLAALIGLPERNNHQALNDARITHKVMASLLEELNSPVPARQLQRWVLSRAEHPWAAFFDPQDEPVPLDAVVPEVPMARAPKPTGRINVEAVVAMFEEGGKLMTPGFQPRPQQARMAALVSETLGEPNQRRMIEAPTGTGKTLAYLVPAIEVARASGRVSVVAPHSRVLQDQILQTLEELQLLLAPFATVVLKGKQNYVSLKALQAELDWLDIEYDDRSSDRGRAMALAILCGWVAQTPSGDWSDLRTASVDGHLGTLRLLRWKLRVEASPGPLRGRLDELDFYRRALAKLNVARVAVLNHALLAAGPNLEEGEFNLIVDEAHNLEDAATAASTKEVSVGLIEMLCDSLWQPATRRGLVSRIAEASGAGLMDERIRRVREASDAVRRAMRRLSEPLVEHVRDRTGVTREQAARFGVSHRIVPGADRRHGTYRRVEDAGRGLRSALGEVAVALNGVEVPRTAGVRRRRDALEDEIARLGREARNAAQLVDAVLWTRAQLKLVDDDSDEDLTQWINIAEVSFEAASGGDERDAESVVSDSASGQWRWSLRRAPLSVAGMLTELWQRSNSVVLTSATLRAGNDLSYLSGRLGLKEVIPTIIPSPYLDLDQRHLVLLTDYLPAPRGQLMDRFTEVAAAEIPRLCLAADGGAMTLMTARARLEFVRDHARPALAAEQIELLVQGEGSSGALMERMRAESSACLLGLRSFWEGVDIAGDALRLLMIEKIPFDSLGDPIMAARQGLLELQGRDPFADYLVPRAAIAFAQGVGRLIRNASDVGVTVVLDNRMRRPLPYVDVMWRSLAGPPSRREIDNPDEAYEAVAGHLGLTVDDEWRERIDRVPGVATLSRAILNVDEADAPLDDVEIDRRLEIAKKWLGFDEWRPGQVEVMRRFMRGEDVIAVLPTGAGKSVTYQIPALVSPGVTLVVSPLIALMRDQVDNLRSRGVSEVAALYSGVGQAEQQAVLDSAAKGHIKLLYVSPERLWSPTFRAWLEAVDVARIAVDEAHCISLWGHSFRPEYAMIPRAVAAVAGGRLPVAAVTATGTPEVIEDVARLLELQHIGEPLVGSVDRPEIRYYVERCRNRKDRDLRAVQVVEAFRRRSAIVYVPTRNDTIRLSGLLRSFGHRVRPYSGAMELSERQHTEDAFRHGEIDVVVATKAFGLGIDKPDIELIVHLEMPASIEEYVQETGRAARGARDGTGPAIGTAVLLVTLRDCRIHEFFVKSSAPDIASAEAAWSRLSEGMNFINPDEFVEPVDSDSGEADDSIALALHYLEQVGAVLRHQDFVLRGRVSTMESASQRMPGRAATRPALAKTSERVLKLVDEENGEYRGRKWAAEIGMSPPQVEEAVFELHRAGICGFSAWKYGWVFERRPGVSPEWKRLESLIDKRRAGVSERAEQARSFAHGRPDCRRREMLRYLGEPDPPAAALDGCGGCDACTPSLERPWEAFDVTADDVAEALREDAEAVMLILIDSVERGRFSRRNLVRTVHGDSGGKFPLHDSLRSHGCFGRLSLLEEHEVEGLIDRLIDNGLAEEAVPEERDYKTLELTSDGRQRLRGVVG